MYSSKSGIFAPTAKIPLVDYFVISDKIFHLKTGTTNFVP